VQLRRDFRGRCKARQQGQGFEDVEGVVEIEPQACFSMTKGEAGWCASFVMGNTVMAAGKSRLLILCYAQEPALMQCE
jgi:hypothetical protein